MPEKWCCLEMAQSTATPLGFKGGTGFWVAARHADAFLSLATYNITMFFYLCSMWKSETVSRYSQNTGLETVPAVLWMRKRCQVRSVVSICIISRVTWGKSSQNANLRKHIGSPGFLPPCIPGEGLKSQVWTSSWGVTCLPAMAYIPVLFLVQGWPGLTPVLQRHGAGSSIGVPELGSFPRTDVAVDAQVSWAEKCPSGIFASVCANGRLIEGILTSLRWLGRHWTAVWEKSPTTYFFKMQVIFWIHHYSQDRNKVSNILLCRINQDPLLSFPPTYSDCTRRVPLLGCQTSSGRRTKINMRQWCHPSGTMASCQNKALGILLTPSVHFPASFCPLSLSPLFRCSLTWKRSGSPKDKFLWFLWKRVSR